MNILTRYSLYIFSIWDITLQMRLQQIETRFYKLLEICLQFFLCKGGKTMIRDSTQVSHFIGRVCLDLQFHRRRVQFQTKSWKVKLRFKKIAVWNHGKVVISNHLQENAFLQTHGFKKSNHNFTKCLTITCNARGCETILC